MSIRKADKVADVLLILFLMGIAWFSGYQSGRVACTGFHKDFEKWINMQEYQGR